MLKKNIKMLLLGPIFLFFASFHVAAETIEIDFVYVGEEDQSALLGGHQGLY